MEEHLHVYKYNDVETYIFGNWDVSVIPKPTESQVFFPAPSSNVFESTPVTINSTENVKNRSFVCSICQKSLSTKYSLKAHKRLHTDNEQVECEFCKKKFASDHSVQTHKLNHCKKNCKVGRFSCKICLKALKTAHALSNHEKLHTDCKKCLCQLCSKRFVNKWRLQQHIRGVHMKFDKNKQRIKKPKEESASSDSGINCKIDRTVCTICFKQFKTADSRLNHEKLHMDRKEFVCQFCSKRFVNKWRLRQHIRGVHMKLNKNKQRTKKHKEESASSDSGFNSLQSTIINKQ